MGRGLNVIRGERRARRMDKGNTMAWMTDFIRFSFAGLAFAGFTAAAHGLSAPATSPGQVPSTDSCALLEMSVYFEPGSGELNEVSRSLIEFGTSRLDGCEIARIEATGFADATGDPGTNLKLSEARAQAVLAAFEASGLKPHMIKVDAMGDTGGLNADGTMVPMRRKTDIRVVPADLTT